jgi:hypothetical protein
MLLHVRIQRFVRLGELGYRKKSQVPAPTKMAIGI